MDAIRSLILREVEIITPLDALEKEHISDVKGWISSGVEIFRIEKPDNPPKHLVSYFVLIDKEKQFLLLVDHIKAQLWLSTGGHVDVSEDPRETVKREAREELGIDAAFLNNELPFFITVTRTVGLTAGHTDVSLWYLLKGSVNEELRFDPTEFKRVQWFSFDEVLGMPLSSLDPQMHRFVQKLILHKI